MTLALAVDLGGTKVEAALVDAQGTIVPGSRHREATGPAAALDAEVARVAIDAVVRRALADAPAEVVAAGIGAAGPIDVRAGSTSPCSPASAPMPRSRRGAASSPGTASGCRGAGVCCPGIISRKSSMRASRPFRAHAFSGREVHLSYQFRR